MKPPSGVLTAGEVARSVAVLEDKTIDYIFEQATYLCTLHLQFCNHSGFSHTARYLTMRVIWHYIGTVIELLWK